MRLGADPVKLHDGTRVREIYGEAVIYERHRHRYEVNNLLRKRLEAAGLVCSRHVAGRPAGRGDRAPRDVHPFFVASQFHPEFKSRPERPAPLFREFVRAGRRARRWPRSRGRAPRRGRPRRRPPDVSAGRRGRPPAPQRPVRRALPHREPSGRERGCAARSRAELRALGPGGRGRRGGQPARARAARRAADATAACCSAPTSTRSRCEAPVEPALVDEGWENANDGILGADNKAARGDAARDRAPRGGRAAAHRPRAAVHRLARRSALAGAQAFDARQPAQPASATSSTTPRRSARSCSPRPPTTASRPTSTAPPRTPASARRQGRSAIAAAARARSPRCRSAASTRRRRRTSARSPAAAAIERRARALPRRGRGPRRSTSAKAEAVVAEMVDHIHDGGNAARVRRRRRPSSGSSTATASRPSAPPVQSAEAALRACGYEPRHIVTGGGSDANALDAAGFACVNLANGTERNHEPGERVSVAALEGMLDVTLALLDEADAARRAVGLQPRRCSRATPSSRRRRAAGRVRGERLAGRSSTASAASARASPTPALVGPRARSATRSSSTSQARDLGLGSGGFDVVHVNLTRGLDGAGVPGAHVMKLNYTSLQHAVLPVEGDELRRCRSRRPVARVRAARPARARGLGARAGARRARGSATCRPPAARCPAGIRDTVRELRDARPARRPPDRRPGLRRRGRGDHDRRRDPPRPARDCGWDAALVRARPGDPRLGLGARPRRDGRARLRARGARARLPDAARRAHVLRRPARAPPRPLAPHAHRARRCCSSR